MTTRVEVSPSLLRWARHRAGLSIDDLSRQFPKLLEWERGQQLPTLRQLESYARATHTAVGLLFLPERTGRCCEPNEPGS
jgi:transcriptional regulator with XRE-family HTH domain